MSDVILFGGGKFWWCSNFAAFRMLWKGLVYPTSEHIYQAEKFEDEKHRAIVRDAASPRDAKRFATTNKHLWRQDWADLRDRVMEEIIRAKAAQHDYVARKLEETSDRTIIENSPEDSYWGNGSDGLGRNQLGKTWMKIRAERRIASQ